MPAFEYEGLKITVDEEGYLVNFDDWNEKVACALAEREGVEKTCPMNREQLEILQFIREYYKKFNSVPIVRAVCTNVPSSPRPVNISSFRILSPPVRLPEYPNSIRDTI